jgi:hypothetical protein
MPDDILQEIAADADQADALAEKSSKASADRLRSAWDYGWEKGLAGLLDERKQQRIQQSQPSAANNNQA